LSARAPACILLIGILLFARAAGAHEAGISRGTYAFENGEVTAEITFSHDDFVLLGRALGFADTWQEEGDAEDVAETVVSEGLGATADGERCPGRLEVAQQIPGALVIRARFRCPAGKPNPWVKVQIDLLKRLPAAHQHILERKGRPGTITVMRPAPGFDLANEPPPVAKPEGFAGFLVAGLRRIASPEHLALLVGLVIMRRRLRELALAAASFVLACSLGLVLAAYAIWSPRAEVIAPLLALSVLYVGLEDLFVDEAASRWRAALPFGLVHGFAVATPLAALALPTAEVAGALGPYWVGVVLGTLALLALVVPASQALHRREFFARRSLGVRVLGGAVGALGLVSLATHVLALVSS
jgi:hypothetical protein